MRDSERRRGRGHRPAESCLIRTGCSKGGSRSRPGRCRQGGRVRRGRVCARADRVGCVLGQYRDGRRAAILWRQSRCGSRCSRKSELPVQPGSYEITTTSPGMETWKGSFLLAVGQTAEISPVLKVGAVTTQVTVGDAAPLVSTSDATISRNLEHARIEQLPVDGRSISNLVLTSTPSLVGGQDGAINPIDTGLRDAVELYQDGAVKKNRDVG